LIIPVCDYWIVINNSVNPFQLVAEGMFDGEMEIKEETVWKQIKNSIYEE
jgi:hypothetical protein